ncbi:hypothetical protein EUGRSUZ_B03451 [Eucalyptus grandis]|uniref:Uncharacterized protein n=2 Tax=Eucalyptus grandis TaxID=71139 RepID=A0ACC3LVU3_EUCGR|nr:hypothetical protein EUGRSUZ_B03451 [Eucalyptus grandis]
MFFLPQYTDVFKSTSTLYFCTNVLIMSSVGVVDWNSSPLRRSKLGLIKASKRPIRYLKNLQATQIIIFMHLDL